MAESIHLPSIFPTTFNSEIRQILTPPTIPALRYVILYIQVI